MIQWLKTLLYGYPVPRTPVNVRVVYKYTVSSGKKYKIQYEDTVNPKGAYQSRWTDIWEWLGCGNYKGSWFNWIEYGGSESAANRKAQQFIFIEDIERFNKKQQALAEKQYKKWEKKDL